MFKVGIIGAGHISLNHIEAYNELDNCTIVAIADLNKELAEERAKTYNIESVYTDYKELLKDESIDAVSIVTPTFTHKDIIIDALKKGKHVLCEKPPALNAEEVLECERVAKETGKRLMFAFVCRFLGPYAYVKDYIKSGRMGKIVSAECVRTRRCIRAMSWFASRKLGGGALRDGCIHQLDSILYFMDYPNPVSVVATETFVNSSLPDRINATGWESCDKTVVERDIESAIEGFVVLDNGACIHVKAASVLNVVKEERVIGVIGEKAGVTIAPDAENVTRINLVELENDTFKESTPDYSSEDAFNRMISHFADCVLNGVESISTPSQAVTLMKIIDAFHESAETGKPVVFK